MASFLITVQRPDPPRRLLLSIAVKVMAYLLLAALALVMLKPLLLKDNAPEPLRVKVGLLSVGQSQGLEWNRRRLLLVRPSETGSYLAILDYDPLYGCPLQWVPPGATSPPLSPWPGGFRAICFDHWYNSAGKSLQHGVGDLQPVPFTQEADDTLIFSELP